jgi:hypothetical protein
MGMAKESFLTCSTARASLVRFSVDAKPNAPQFASKKTNIFWNLWCSRRATFMTELSFDAVSGTATQLLVDILGVCLFNG